MKFENRKELRLYRAEAQRIAKKHLRLAEKAKKDETKNKHYKIADEFKFFVKYSRYMMKDSISDYREEFEEEQVSILENCFNCITEMSAK